MANFTFDSDDEARRINAADGKPGAENLSGGPGSNNGTGSPQSTASGNANNNSGTAGANSSSENNSDAPYGYKADGTPRKRRAKGYRNNPEYTGTNTSAGKEGGTEGLAVKNDRVKVRTNIEGMHMIAAVLTKQPIMILKPEEAEKLTDAVCDVADYHQINLIGVGGPTMLYATLATTMYAIYAPRMQYIKHMKASDEAKPINPGEYTGEAETQQRRAGTMDYSADTMQ